VTHAHSDHGVAPRPAGLDLGDIFRRHAHEASALALTPHQHLVLERITTCRTAALGGHLEVCTHCGFERPVYNSCRDRHCPKCQATRQAKWVALRLERIVPVPHFHVVFTLPGLLRRFATANPRLAYDLLLTAAGQTLLAFGQDPKWLGGQIGATLILHTWRRDLSYHPHVHAVVTAGGLSPNGQAWLSPSRGARFLFPVGALAKVFRGKVLAALAAHGAGTLAGLPADPTSFDKLLDRLYRTRWHVYAKQPLGGGTHIFRYLGRYTHRVAMSNARLIAADANSVTFATKDGQQATLSPLELMRRFLQHVLPVGFTKIRHVGLYASAHVKGRLVTARRLVAAAPGAGVTQSERGSSSDGDTPTASREDILVMLFGPELFRCPACKLGRMRLIESIKASPQATGPP